MSAVSTSTSPMTPMQVYQRLLAIDAAAAGAYLATQSDVTAGEMVAAAQTASDLDRATRRPRGDRSYRDTFRTR